MRLFIVPALLVATVAVATPAFAAPLQHFSQDGEDYSYTAARTADGAVLLRGTVDSTGDAFVLRVNGQQVSGHLGVGNVAFTVSPETAARLSDEVPMVRSAAPATLAAN